MNAEQLWIERITYITGDVLKVVENPSETTNENGAIQPNSELKSEKIISSLHFVDFTKNSKTEKEDPARVNEQCDSANIKKDLTAESLIDFFATNRRYIFDEYGYLSLFPVAYPDLCLAAMDGDRIVGIFFSNI